MRGIKITMILIALLISSSAMGKNNIYFSAIEMAEQHSYAKAVTLFRSQLSAFKDNPIYLNRTHVWLALLLLTQDDHASEAENMLHEVLCLSLSTQEKKKILKTCAVSKPLKLRTTLDIDMINAAVSAYASLQWRKKEHITSIQFFTLLIQRVVSSDGLKSVTSSNNKFSNESKKRSVSEPKIFYQFANKTLCKSLNSLKVSTNTMGDLLKTVQRFSAASLEASRGQGVQNYKISQRPFLRALSDFLDKKKVFTLNIENSTRYRASFLKRLMNCTNSINFGLQVTDALSVALAHSSGYETNETYINLLLSITKKLRVNSKENKAEGGLEAHELLMLGDYYLRNHKPVKAQQKFKQALAKFKPYNKEIGITEYTYLPFEMAAKTIQSLIALAPKTKNNIAYIEKELHKLRRDTSFLKTEIGSRLVVPAIQDLNTNLEIVNQVFGESFLQSMQDMTSNLKTNIFGSLIEQQYTFYNNQAQLMLQLAHIELDLNKMDAAKQQILVAETFIQAHDGWIDERTKAYLAFTQARVYEVENKVFEASKAFLSSIKGWYFTPRSLTEIISSPLSSPTQILEHAASFEIAQGQPALAFNYIELARESSRKNPKIFGSLSASELSEKNISLLQQAKYLAKLAAKNARSKREGKKYKIAQKKLSESFEVIQRGQMDSAYNLLIEINAYTPWLKPYDVGLFVGQAQQLINLRRMEALNKERKDFLYQQQEVKAFKSKDDSIVSIPQNSLGLAADIQKRLAKDTLLISIWMGRDKSYILAVDKKGVRSHKENSLALTDLVKVFNKAYSQRHGYKLFKKLLAPYLNRNYKRILLVVNGALKNTAFAALSTDPNKLSWLGDKYLLRTLSKSEYLLRPIKKSADTTRVLVLNGSSVPGEEKLETAEIKSIFQYFSGKHIKGEQLTKKNVMEQLPNYAITHFAGHSNVNNDFPDFSHLSLYKDKAYLLELEKLPLNKVRLIVLGSCRSARFANSRADAPFSSLQESLINAGAESVLANLFVVDDLVASKLMSKFYQFLADGLSKDSALQRAQQSIRLKYPNPKDWAGFVLSGSEKAL